MTTTCEEPLPHLHVDGCTNFRDAGGWPLADGGRMRTGALYRSDDPIRLTAAGRSTVDSLGLTLVVDLRQESQRIRSPGFQSAERTVNLPLVDRVIDPQNPPRLESPTDIAELYDGMLERSREQFARALDLIAENVGGGPILVHCAFGKDRAGLMSALVQAAIGVTDQAIVDDYNRSHEPTRRRRAWMLAEPLPDDPNTSNVPEFLFSAPAATMTSVVERMNDRHGSLQNWVAAFPIAADTIDRLLSGLVDRSGVGA